MKRMAMVLAGVVVGVAAWDGESPWDPVGAGLCDTLVDVTDEPGVGPGSSYSGGAFGPAPAGSPPPDPAGFLRAVTLDAGISVGVRNALGPWLYGLGAAIAVGDTELVSAAWGNLVAVLPIGSADRAAVVAHAQALWVPGIS